MVARHLGREAGQRQSVNCGERGWAGVNRGSTAVTRARSGHLGGEAVAVTQEQARLGSHRMLGGHTLTQSSK